VREGFDLFLKNFGTAEYHSEAEYTQRIGMPLGEAVSGTEALNARFGAITVRQASLESDPKAEANYFGPRRRMLQAYLQTMDRLHLDGYVYPAIQMPPVDETLPQDGRVSEGPHSATSWVNMLGVPAVVVVGGVYPGGLPFGLEFSTRPWKDGDLLGYAYAWEQATHHRHPPVLVDQGLLRQAP
jgi:Asp-tRNA(Asn)/Glu-tRNA(Gln) amidotransferase A subunit family amidase